MEKQCINHLKVELGALKSEQERLLKEVQEMFSSLNSHFDQLMVSLVYE